MRLITGLLLTVNSALPMAAEVKVAKLSAAEEAPRELSAPIAGYSVQAASRQVRLILGVPGSTHYSEPSFWPAEVTALHTTPGHHWLLALRGQGGAASVLVPERGTDRVLAKVSGDPSLISISPTGAAAAFFWRAEKRMVVYRGLPDSPELAAEIVNDAWTAAGWASLAVSGDGRLVTGISESGELSLLVQDAEPSSKLVREARPLASFGFFGDDNTLAVAEAGSDRVELIGSMREGSFTRKLLNLPVAATATARLLAGGAGWFSLIDPGNAVLHRLAAAGAVRTFGLEGIPMAGLEPLRTRGATLLQAPDGEVPRIVLSHAEGDELFYHPTLAVEERQ
jgi:hypothetical protein